MFLLRRRLVDFVGSLILDLLAGYGYRPFRLVIFYLVVLGGYSALYYSLTNLGLSLVAPMRPDESLAFSVQVHIGRSAPGNVTLLDTVNILADTEILSSIGIGFIFGNLVSKRFFGAK